MRGTAVQQVDHWTALWRETETHGSIRALNEGRDPISRLLRRMQELAPVGRGLDHGCGFGRVSLLLEGCGWEMVGVDFSVEGLRAARGAGVEQLLCTDVRALPFRSGMFDGAVSFGVVEHIPEGPAGALTELRRVLRRDAVALLTVPYENPWRRVRARIGKESSSYRQGHRILTIPAFPDEFSEGFYQYAFTPTEFTAHLEHAGFTVEERIPHSVFKGLRDTRLGDRLHNTLQTRHGKSRLPASAQGSSTHETSPNRYLRSVYDETDMTLASKFVNRIAAPIVGHMMAYFVRAI